MEYFDVIKRVASLSNLSKTDVEILKTLHEKRKMLISEIVEHIKRSERHVRQRLQVLIEKGFLKKEIEILKNKRLAYQYSLRSIKSITDETKTRLRKNIDDLDRLIVE